MGSSRTKMPSRPSVHAGCGERKGESPSGSVVPFSGLRCALALVFALIWSLNGCVAGKADHYNRAVEKHQRNRLPEAVEEYRQAIRQNPGDPKARFTLAVIYQDQGRMDEAGKYTGNWWRDIPIMPLHG